MGELSSDARGSFEGGRHLQGGPTALIHPGLSVSLLHHHGQFSVPRKLCLLPIHKTTRNITWNPRRPHGRAQGRCSQESLEDWGGASLEPGDQGLGKQAGWDAAGGGPLERQHPLSLGEALGLRLEAGRPEEGPVPCAHLAGSGEPPVRAHWSSGSQHRQPVPASPLGGKNYLGGFTAAKGEGKRKGAEPSVKAAPHPQA